MENSQQLPSKIKHVWQLTAIIYLVIGLFIAGIVGTAAFFFDWPKWIHLILIIIVVLDFIFELAIIPYRYRFWRYQITSTDVEIDSGFFIRKQTAIPISRVQNVSLDAGPLYQLFHLQKVKIQTAAASHDISGVEEETAKKLKDRIIELAKEEEDIDAR